MGLTSGMFCFVNGVGGAQVSCEAQDVHDTSTSSVRGVEVDYVFIGGLLKSIFSSVERSWYGLMRELLESRVIIGCHLQ